MKKTKDTAIKKKQMSETTPGNQSEHIKDKYHVSNPCKKTVGEFYEDVIKNGIFDNFDDVISKLSKSNGDTKSLKEIYPEIAKKFHESLTLQQKAQAYEGVTPSYGSSKTKAHKVKTNSNDKDIYSKFNKYTTYKMSDIMNVDRVVGEVPKPAASPVETPDTKQHRHTTKDDDDAYIKYAKGEIEYDKIFGTINVNDNPPDQVSQNASDRTLYENKISSKYEFPSKSVGFMYTGNTTTNRTTIEKRDKDVFIFNIILEAAAVCVELKNGEPLYIADTPALYDHVTKHTMSPWYTYTEFTIHESCPGIIHAIEIRAVNNSNSQKNNLMSALADMADAVCDSVYVDVVQDGDGEASDSILVVKEDYSCDMYDEYAVMEENCELISKMASAVFDWASVAFDTAINKLFFVTNNTAEKKVDKLVVKDSFLVKNNNIKGKSFRVISRITDDDGKKYVVGDFDEDINGFCMDGKMEKRSCAIIPESITTTEKDYVESKAKEIKVAT